MKCPRCLNTDESLFYRGSRGWYCRRCISFGRMMIEENLIPIGLSTIADGSEEYQLKYALTPAQEKIARACAEAIDSSDVLLQCVCGAGKTEMVIYTIAKLLKKKNKICFAIPRRQVVMELGLRMQTLFPNAKVVRVCGGMTDEIDGDLIICTTHQLYRYYRAFDCLILDEPDAFPFRGSDVLHGIAETACKGHRIYLTATPDESLLKAVENRKMVCFQLNERPHQFPLPVPQCHVGFSISVAIYLLRWIFVYRKHPRMIFVPTISMAEKLFLFLNLFFHCCMCTSRSENRDAIISDYQRKKDGLMVTTTIMERGITIPDVQVCVLFAEHPVFDLASLIQMSGRVGRTFAFPQGSVLFLCHERSEKVDQCIKLVQMVNQRGV